MNLCIKTYLPGLLLLLLFPFQGLNAQNGGFAGASSRTGFSPRGMAMANAYTATTSEGIYAYYNPALAATYTNSNQIDISVASMEFDRIFQTFGSTFQLPPSAGISFYILRSGIKDIDGRSLSGYPTGMFDVSEYQFAADFGIRMSEKLNVGIGFKFNYADYHEDLSPGTTIGIDLGLLYHLSSYLNFGFTIQDLFATYKWNPDELYDLDQSRNVENSFPVRYKWGLAFQKEKFSISGEYEIQAYSSEAENSEVLVSDGQISVYNSTETVKTHSSMLRLGGAWYAHERLTLRGGYQVYDLGDIDSWGLSTGFSVNLPFDKFSPSIDYAFVMEPYRVSNMHVFALRLNL